MIKRRFAVGLLALVVIAGPAWAYFQVAPAGPEITTAATAYLELLSPAQRKVSLLQYDAEQRVDWHFIPKDYRKGLQIRDMKPPQRQAALALLRSTLSKAGYSKATQIMELESILAELEKDKKGGNIRDPERYYFTLFGKPSEKGRWGLSIEGHHLSLNFVLEANQVISSTPSFFAANPATVMAAVPNTKIKKGTRVLADEEQQAFDLLGMLNDEQQAAAVIAEQAPREIRAAGEPQPPADESVGLPAAKMNKEQRKLLVSLIKTYANNLPQQVARGKLKRLDEEGLDAVRFAWAGAHKPGVGHYYRIQGKSFLIEFVNTQPDAAGNPANHIHCVYRDMQGDFALPIK